MNRKKYIVVLSAFILILAAIIIGIILKPNENTEEEIIRSDEYIYYDERFDFVLSADESYYIITLLEEDYRTETTIKIPNTIDNIPVKKIVDEYNDFLSWKDVVSIEIPANVEYIGTEINDDGILNGGTYGTPFCYYNSKTVAINVSKENMVYSSIDGVLYNKDHTILIKMPNNKLSGNSYTLPASVIEVYDKAFYYNRGIRSIILSTNLEKIGAYAFYNCENLQTIIFNDTLKLIADSAFKNCSLQDIVLPESVLELGKEVFAYNDVLQSIYIPKSIIKFGSNIISGCKRTIKVYTTSDNVENLKNIDSFYNKEILIR